MASPLLTLAFVGCRVDVWTPEYLETVFPGDRKARALFTYDDDVRMNAERLAYGWDELRRFHVDHELGHTIVAEAQGLDYSPTLAHVAGVRELAQMDRWAEEALVFAVQRYANDGTRDAGLSLFGVRLDETVQRLRTLSRAVLLAMEAEDHAAHV